MVLKVPRLNASPLALCDRPFSLLGFGDILVPGTGAGLGWPGGLWRCWARGAGGSGGRGGAWLGGPGRREVTPRSMVPAAQTCPPLQLLCPQGPTPPRWRLTRWLPGWGWHWPEVSVTCQESRVALGPLHGGAPSLHGNPVAQLGHGQASAHSFCTWPVSAGLLVAYCHRFDIQVQSSRVYFVACTIGKPTARSSTHITASSLYTVVTVSLFFLVFVFLFFLLSSVCFVCKFIDTKRMLPHFLSSLVVSKMVQTTSLVPLGQLFRMSGVAEGTGPATATSGPGGHRLAFPSGVLWSHCCPPFPWFPEVETCPPGRPPGSQSPGSACPRAPTRSFL